MVGICYFYWIFCSDSHFHSTNVSLQMIPWPFCEQEKDLDSQWIGLMHANDFMVVTNPSICRVHVNLRRTRLCSPQSLRFTCGEGCMLKSAWYVCLVQWPQRTPDSLRRSNIHPANRSTELRPPKAVEFRGLPLKSGRKPIQGSLWVIQILKPMPNTGCTLYIGKGSHQALYVASASEIIAVREVRGLNWRRQLYLILWYQFYPPTSRLLTLKDHLRSFPRLVLSARFASSRSSRIGPYSGGTFQDNPAVSDGESPADDRPAACAFQDLINIRPDCDLTADRKGFKVALAMIMITWTEPSEPGGKIQQPVL